MLALFGTGALALLVVALRVARHPDPIGIGAGPAILAGAAVSEVDRENYSVAGAVNQTARQLAGAIGLAVLVALLGSSAGSEIELAAFRRAFVYLGTVAALASLVATRLPPRRPDEAGRAQ